MTWLKTIFCALFHKISVIDKKYFIDVVTGLPVKIYKCEKCNVDFMATKTPTFFRTYKEINTKQTQIYKRGLDVFGSKDKFISWLNTKSFALGRLRPVDLYNTGVDEDLDILDAELTKIEHGIFA